MGCYPHSTQHPDKNMLIEKSGQTISFHEQQLQAPSTHDVENTTKINKSTNCSQNKLPVDPTLLINKLSNIDERRYPKSCLEVNNTCPFIHDPCPPCVEAAKKQLTFEQNISYEPYCVLQPIECNAYAKHEVQIHNNYVQTTQINKPILKQNQTTQIEPCPPCREGTQFESIQFVPCPPCQADANLQTQKLKLSQLQQTQPTQFQPCQPCQKITTSPVNQNNRQVHFVKATQTNEYGDPCAMCPMRVHTMEKGNVYYGYGYESRDHSGMRSVHVDACPKSTHCCWGGRSGRHYEHHQRSPEGILGLTEVTNGARIWKMLFAEFMGTLLLVLLGCGAILSIGGIPSTIEIAMAFGLTIGSIVQIIGHLSGGHINPAVTLSFFITCEIKLLRTILYIVAQLLGAAAGAALLMVATPDDLEGGLGITGVGSGVHAEQAFLYEVILSFFFILVIHTVADSQRKDIKSAPALLIGLAAAAAHLSGIKFSGSSMNPARSFGPALVTNHWDDHWIYWAGPIIGGCLAGLLYKFLLKPKKSDDESYDF